MSFCSACGAELEGNEKFCGACGKPVVQAALPPEENPAPVTDNNSIPIQAQDPTARKNPEQPQPAPASGQKWKMPFFVIAALLILGGTVFFSQQNNDVAPTMAQQTPAPASNTAGPTAPAAAPAPAEPSAEIETISEAVRDYIELATQANIEGGVAAIAPHRMSVPSCTNCAPIMIYCVEPFESVADLKGRAIRAHSSTAKALVEQIDGNLQLLNFGEVSQAMQMGLIDCSMSGGIVPQ